MRLSQSTARSALWLILRFGGRQLANSVAFFVLAALMTPSEFGVASLAAAIAMLLRTLLARGLRDVVIQREDLTDEVLDTAWWLNFGLGLILALGMAASAPIVAIVFGEPKLTGLMIAAAFIPFFAGASAVQEARVERAFRHHLLTTAQLVASLLAAGIAIALAMSGAGATSLVAFSLVEALGVAIVTCLLARWLPGLRFSRTEAAQQIRFAWPIAVSFTFTTGNIRFAQLIVGAVLGVQATAFFRVACQVNQLLTQTVSAPVVQVLLPAFARLKERHADQYARALSAVSALSFPAFLGAAAVAPYVLPLVLGEKWRPAAELTGVLCFAIFPSIALQVLNPMLIANGLTGRASQLSIASALTGLLATGIGAMTGLMGAALGFAGRGVVTVPAGFVTARRLLGVSIADQLRAMGAYAGAAMVMYALVRIGLWRTESMGLDWLRIAVAVAAGAAVYAVIVRLAVSRFAPKAYEPLRSAAPGPFKRFL